MALVLFTGLAGCISFDEEARKQAQQTAQLQQPARDSYPRIIAAFIEHCVKSDGEVPVANSQYFIKRTEQSCSLYTDTYYDDDTVLAALMLPELQKADQRFTRMPFGMLGASWTIGDTSKWSYLDGRPLVSLGRRSAKDKLIIQRMGPSLQGMS